MKNMRKLLAIVLCLLLVTISFVTVSAEESEFSGIVSKSVKAVENGDVEVLIDIAGNPGIVALILEVSYDSDVLTLKEDGFADTGLLVGNVETTIDINPFRLGWQDSGATSENNYKNGTIGKLSFEMKEDFYGTTDVVVTYISAQSLINKVYTRPPVTMKSGVISVTRDRLAIKDGVAMANNANGETFIVASYNGDEMIDCKTFPNSTGDVQIQIADVLNTSGATKYKAFLWKNLENCIPVCDCAEEEL